MNIKELKGYEEYYNILNKCEAYGLCDLEKFITHYKCTKCGKIINKN